MLEGDVVYGDGAAVTALEQRFAGDADIDAFLPFLNIAAPVMNVSTGDAKPAIQLTGVDFARLETVGGLTMLNGTRANPADLGQTASS